CSIQVDVDTVLLQLAQPLPPGTYTATIGNGSDGNTLLDACQRQVNPGDVLQFVVSAMQATGSATDVSCNGKNDGSATAAGINGVLPYRYSWNTNPVQTGATATGLAPGTYTCTITDANNIVRRWQAVIGEPTALVAGETHKDLDCMAGTMGEATITVSGGTGPYTYNWIGTGGQTTATATGLHAGSYTCIAEDQHQCTVLVHAVIDSVNYFPAAYAGPDITATDVSAVLLKGLPSAAASLWETVAGPSAPVFADATSAQTDASNLQEGVYLIRRTLSNAVCSSSDTMRIVILKSPDPSCRFHVPNAFRPGSNNGLFKPAGSCVVNNYLFAVYNRL
ncbi:MAG: SprB repeat-containing protein, partial [Bacteroidetes bacterium]|nr:SprB repeat-containing protein [Bacteroidota bacterium]